MASQDAIKQLTALMEEVDEQQRNTFQNMHHGYPTDAYVRFLKARDWNVLKAHKMLMDCLNWRLQNEIDNILSKPIVPVDLYRAIRDSQLLGLSGYSKEGLPIFAIGVGQSSFDKASPTATKKYGKHIGACIKILDMTGLKLSALSQIKLLTIISTVDDLNYPEKTEIYYIVNAPYIFSSCWKVVKPLLQERTRKKVQVLQGCGRDELLKIMDFSSLPHFCRRESPPASPGPSNCFSLDHPFHQQLYAYVKQQALGRAPALPLKQGSFHVSIPDPVADGVTIAETIESELSKSSESGE